MSIAFEAALRSACRALWMLPVLAACAAALACLAEYEERGLIDNSRRLGVVLLERLRELARRHPRVGDVRGKGLLACLELVRDGVIASGENLTSMIAGLPEAIARSKAAANSSVFVTVSPWPPQARANAAKSGSTRSVAMTRPG